MKRYFDVICTDWKLMLSEKPAVKLTLSVLEGPEAGEEKIVWGSLAENAAQYTIEYLRCFGWTGNDLESELDKDHGMGTLRAVAVEVDNEYPPGNFTRKVKYINPYKPRAGSVSPKASKDLKKLRALAKSVVVDVDPEAAKVTPGVEPDPF